MTNILELSETAVVHKKIHSTLLLNINGNCINSKSVYVMCS